MVQVANDQPPVGNLLDMMTPEHRQQALARFNRRMAKRDEEKNRISNEMYIVAEFGYYFGWDAVQAIRNNEITLEEVFALTEGARKVWYSKLVETGNVMRVATDSSNPLAKKAQKQKAFRSGMEPYMERAKL